MKLSRIASRVAGLGPTVNVRDYDTAQILLEDLASAFEQWMVSGAEEAFKIDENFDAQTYVSLVSEQARLIRELASGPIADLDEKLLAL